MTNNAEHLQVIEGDEADDALVGTTIDGRYEVERVLGEGGMGLVYQAKHIVLGKPLAIKVLRPDVSKDEEIITRFRQEAQSASSIGNQHIIDISDFGTLPDGSTYFVMEFLKGVDLTGAIEGAEMMEPGRAIHIMKQLCTALGAAHEIGIVHRDMKPDNVYLIERGGDPDFVKVLDFGIAKVGGTSSKLTRAGQVFGTPHYMSPEQCSGSGVDHRTDIYAIGVILYEMLTGTVPFDADNLMGILTKHLYEEVPPPSTVRPDLPPEVEQVVLRCMAKQVEARYQTCAELVDDLNRLQAGVAPAPMPDIPASSTGAYSALPVQQKSSKAPLIGGLVLLLAAGGGAAAFMATQGGEEPTPPPVVVAEPPPAPEPPPVAAQPPPQPEAAPEQAVVRITTVPAGATLYRGNELLGVTPTAVPRPSGDDRLELQLRLEGYENQDFTISSLTLAEELPFTLTAERRRSRSSSRGSSRGRSSAMAASAMTEAPPPMMSRMRSVPQTEVLDPWGN